VAEGPAVARRDAHRHHVISKEGGLDVGYAD
jgi:hypothetical protein